MSKPADWNLIVGLLGATVAAMDRSRFEGQPEARVRTVQIVGGFLLRETFGVEVVSPTLPLPHLPEEDRIIIQDHLIDALHAAKSIRRLADSEGSPNLYLSAFTASLTSAYGKLARP